MANNRTAGAAIDVTIHPIARLRICALLDPVTEEEFATLRRLLEVSDSALSKQLSALVEAGYVRQRRAAAGGKSRMWVALTDEGREAFRRHVAALTTIASGHVT